MPLRDHLIISYAAENSALADWFARRLAALGYAVWYDRFKLLGGEPWPQDIEVAIDQRTFRMLALISYASKDKKNPTGERKKGEVVGKRENIADFVIPLNVDLATSDVPWDLMGTQYIDFSHSWAKGSPAFWRNSRNWAHRGHFLMEPLSFITPSSTARRSGIIRKPWRVQTREDSAAG